MTCMRRITALLLCALLALTLAGCGAKKENLQIFSEDNSEIYMAAAEKHFKNFGWSNTSFMDNAVSFDGPDGSYSVNLGGISEDTRYVVIFSNSSDVLEREAVSGKRFTALVHDDGGDEVSVKLCYRVGTTDNCVTAGKVQSGEMAFNNVYNVACDASLSDAERAELIFNLIYEAISEVEG